MVYDQQRVIELYEKGILTKEEARACFVEMEADDGGLFLEEKAKLQFTLPHFKVFSSSKLKQSFTFTDIEAMRLRLAQGRVHFFKHKKPEISVSIVFPQQPKDVQLPKWYIERETLYFETVLPCTLELGLPDKWMSVLDLNVGQADARLDYLPFEDMCIHSDTDQKQQEVRLAGLGQSTQHMDIRLTHAHVSLVLPKQVGLVGKIEGRMGEVVFNRKKQVSPIVVEKEGNERLSVSVLTTDSSISMKEVRHVWHV